MSENVSTFTALSHRQIGEHVGENVSPGHELPEPPSWALWLQHAEEPSCPKGKTVPVLTQVTPVNTHRLTFTVVCFMNKREDTPKWVGPSVQPFR